MISDASSLPISCSHFSVERNHILFSFSILVRHAAPCLAAAFVNKFHRWKNIAGVCVAPNNNNAVISCENIRCEPQTGVVPRVRPRRRAGVIDRQARGRDYPSARLPLPPHGPGVLTRARPCMASLLRGGGGDGVGGGVGGGDGWCRTVGR